MGRKPRAARAKQRFEYRATLGGTLYVIAFVLVGLAAVNTQQALLFVIFGLMVGAFFVSVAAARRTLAAVSVRRDMPSRTFANRVVHLGYVLRHERRRGACLGLELRELDPPAELDSVGAYCLYLPAGATFKSGSRFVVRRRGRFELHAIRLSTRFPFSLLRAQRDVLQDGALVVWPALGRLLVDPLSSGATEVSDAAPSQVRSGSDEFFGLREYRHGDNPRWIHWRRSAGSRMPVVREMSKPRPDVLYVVLEAHLQPDSPQARRERERLISFAATLIEHAFRRQFQVGLATCREGRPVALAARGGRGRRTELLDALADIGDGADGPACSAMAAVPRRLLRHAHVVLIAPGAPTAERLEGLRAACRRLTVVTPQNLSTYFRDDPHAPEAGEPADDGRRRGAPAKVA